MFEGRYIYSYIENLKVTKNLDQAEIFYVCHNVASNNLEILAISMFQHYTSYNQNNHVSPFHF